MSKRKIVSVEGFEGEKYSGTPTEVVEAMRRSSFGGEKAAGIAGFMKQIAKRVFDWNGKRVRINRAALFLEDLAKAGLIKLGKGSGGKLSAGE